MNFDVLMVTYAKDASDYLSDAIRSIYEDQSVKPCNVVLVVNGLLPEDNEKVIEYWQARLGILVFKVIRLDCNLGLGHALNEGLVHCSSDWVARMDADDLSMPKRFELQVDYLKENPDIQLLGGAIQPFYTLKGGSDLVDQNQGVLMYPSNFNSIRLFISKGSPFAHPTIFAKKQLLKNYPYRSNLFNPQTGSSNEDIELWFRLVKDRIPMANISKVVLKFRITDNFYSRRSISKAFAEFRIYCNGIYRLFGCTWRFIFPFTRLIIRLSPHFVSKFLYKKRNELYRL
jgi:glycosyltransferase involved in cell wall biosynthesis